MNTEDGWVKVGSIWMSPRTVEKLGRWEATLERRPGVLCEGESLLMDCNRFMEGQGGPELKRRTFGTWFGQRWERQMKWGKVFYRDVAIPEHRAKQKYINVPI